MSNYDTTPDNLPVPQDDGAAKHLFGLSTQDTACQQEMVERLQLPFPVLSDEHLHFQKSLNLPTFESLGQTLLKRLTIVAHEGVIQTVHYPIFPSDSDAAWVLDYLKAAP